VRRLRDGGRVHFPNHGGASLDAQATRRHSARKHGNTERMKEEPRQGSFGEEKKSQGTANKKNMNVFQLIGMQEHH